VLHDQDASALTINRYIHLNPARVAYLGGHEGRAGATQHEPDREMIDDRVAALNYRWSSYNVYGGKEKNPGWLTTDSIYNFFDQRTARGLCAAYRRQLEQMAALGDFETDWKDKISASLLLGSDSFVRQMLKRLSGNRHEQLGLRQSERLGPDWKTICGAVSEVWKEDWETLTSKRANGALPAAWYLARNFAGMRLAELGSAGGDVAYSAVSMAISRFEKRLEVDRDLQRRIKALRAILEL
jgi:hypothetical protein